MLPCGIHRRCAPKRPPHDGASVRGARAVHGVCRREIYRRAASATSTGRCLRTSENSRYAKFALSRLRCKPVHPGKIMCAYIRASQRGKWVKTCLCSTANEIPTRYLNERRTNVGGFKGVPHWVSWSRNYRKQGSEQGCETSLSFRRLEDRGEVLCFLGAKGPLKT
jgi:hypothetical protein